MSDQTVTCIICNVQCTHHEKKLPEPYWRVTGCKCPSYIILSRDVDRYHKDPSFIEDITRDRLPTLLNERWRRERYYERDFVPVLQFDNKDAPVLSHGVPVRVGELLATWPRTVPETIERAFCNCVFDHGATMPGFEMEIEDWDSHGLFFCHDPVPQAYFLKAMREYGWLEQVRAESHRSAYVVQPKGWQKFDELTRQSSNANNPAFVAMWFGGEDRSQQMQELFDDAIRPAIHRAGYRAKRANTDEHNEQIMDKILFDIQVAPFVVAELTDNNNGVYYEAGYARGRGLEVVICVQEDQKVHFDLTGMNQVRWKTTSDLSTRLEHRIRETQRQGPYNLSGVEVTSKS